MGHYWTTGPDIGSADFVWCKPGSSDLALIVTAAHAGMGLEHDLLYFENCNILICNCQLSLFIASHHGHPEQENTAMRWEMHGGWKTDAAETVHIIVCGHCVDYVFH